MRHRAGDTTPGGLDAGAPTVIPPVRITRDLPLWAILTVIAGIVGQGVALYYGQQSLGQNVQQQSARTAELSVEVRALSASITRSDLDRAATKFAVDDLARRVGELERAARSVRP